VEVGDFELVVFVGQEVADGDAVVEGFVVEFDGECAGLFDEDGVAGCHAGGVFGTCMSRDCSILHMLRMSRAPVTRNRAITSVGGRTSGGGRF